MTTAAVLEPVLWETHATPELGGPAQAILNRQIVDVCDILVGVFWTRLGTPTAGHESGSAEEVDRFLAAGKPVLLYFSSRHASLEKIDIAQYEALREYKLKMCEKGIVWSYSDGFEFRELAGRHLASTMSKLLADEKSREAPAEDAATLFQAQLEIFLRSLQIEWNAEKSSAQPRVKEGQVILRSAVPELLELVAAIESDPEGHVVPQVESAVSRFRDLLKVSEQTLSSTELDDFWARGNSVIDSLWSTATALRLVETP